MDTNRKPFVLFADDNKDTLDLFRIYAQQYDWDADYVTNARDIIDKVNYYCGEMGHCYDLIVADVNYFNQEEGKPRITGITAAWEVRKSYPDIPIVFISAFANSLVREQVSKVGAEIIVKPFDYKLVFQRLEALIYWQGQVCPKNVPAIERRTSSINRTDNVRRKTDRKLAVPPIIMDALTEVRAAKGKL